MKTGGSRPPSQHTPRGRTRQPSERVVVVERRDVLQLLLVGLGIVVDAVVGLRWFAPPVVITPPTRAYHLVAEPGRYAATFAAAGLATVKGEGEAVVRAPVTV